jgi:hypothetical protein
MEIMKASKLDRSDDRSRDQTPPAPHPAPTFTQPVMRKVSSGAAAPTQSDTSAEVCSGFADAMNTGIHGASVADGSGQGIPDGLRARFESSLATDLSGVRVHTDSAAATAANAFGALAFAHGQDVYFGAGQFRPGTTEGDHLIAHEVAHTVQQRGDGVGTGPADAQVPGLQFKRTGDERSDDLEATADHAADAMVRGAPIPTEALGHVAPTVQRVAHGHHHRSHHRAAPTQEISISDADANADRDAVNAGRQEITISDEDANADRDSVAPAHAPQLAEARQRGILNQRLERGEISPDDYNRELDQLQMRRESLEMSSPAQMAALAASHREEQARQATPEYQRTHRQATVQLSIADIHGVVLTGNVVMQFHGNETITANAPMTSGHAQFDAIQIPVIAGAAPGGHGGHGGRGRGHADAAPAAARGQVTLQLTLASGQTLSGNGFYHLAAGQVSMQFNATQGADGSTTHTDGTNRQHQIGGQAELGLNQTENTRGRLQGNYQYTTGEQHSDARLRTVGSDGLIISQVD